MPPRCTSSTTCTSVPVGALSCARIRTPASGFTALIRSTFARTARTSTARLSTQTSPLSRIWIWMVLFSWFSGGVSKLVGRFTWRPDSLTNTAVMMKKIRRLTTKSSIGARSMPVEPSWPWSAERRFRSRMYLETQLIGEQLGLPRSSVLEIGHRIQTRDADREARHRTDHRGRDAARHAARVRAAAQRHRVEHREHARHGADQPE